LRVAPFRPGSRWRRSRRRSGIHCRVARRVGAGRQCVVERLHINCTPDAKSPATRSAAAIHTSEGAVAASATQVDTPSSKARAVRAHWAGVPWRRTSQGRAEDRCQREPRTGQC
jgi:hypothetical protein